MNVLMICLVQFIYLHPSLIQIANQDSFREIVLNFEKSKGRKINSDEFLTLWEQQEKDSLPVKDWMFFKNKHQSALTKEELIDIYESIQSSLENVDMKYTYKKTYSDGNDNLQESWERRFASKNEKKYYSSFNISGRAKDGQTLAFDGKVCRSFQKSKDNHSAGRIRPNYRVSQFIDLEGSILIRSMMFDLKYPLGGDYYWQDIVAFLKSRGVKWISETIYDVDGVKCFTIGSPSICLWIAPEYNFAVTKMVVRSRSKTKLYVSTEASFSDFISHENGLWTPRKAVIKNFNSRSARINNNPSLTEEILVSEIEIDKSINNRLFTEVVPAGSLVFDSQSDVVYRERTKTSVGELLKENIVPLKDDTPKEINYARIAFPNILAFLIVLTIGLAVFRKGNSSGIN